MINYLPVTINGKEERFYLLAWGLIRTGGEVDVLRKKMIDEKATDEEQINIIFQILLFSINRQKEKEDKYDKDYLPTHLSSAEALSYYQLVIQNNLIPDEKKKWWKFW